MSEDKFQFICYDWFHSTYPELRGLLCYNLNNSRNKIQAMMDKGKGLQKGRADMVFYYNLSALHIELKVDGNAQSSDQIKWQKVIESQGFRYVVVKSFEDFKAEIVAFINN